MTIYADPAARPSRAPIDEDYDDYYDYNEPQAQKHRDPLWAKLCLILGSLVMVVSGAVVVIPKIVAAWATSNISREDLLPPGLVGENIDGSINILLLGMDERKQNNDYIRTDTIMIAHIPKNHDQLYLISIPRDTRVDIPAYPHTDFAGQTYKINAAFAMANRTHNERGGWVGDPTAAGRKRGVDLTVQTLNALVPGGLKFNAVAIINFDGFKSILNAIDGVDMCIDERTTSIHYDKNNRYHTNPPGMSQRKVYEKGCRHLKGWEALDFARQRYNVTGADYGRQRHQQQLLMAIFKKLTSKGVVTDLGKLRELQKIAGDLLTLDLGKTAVEDWVLTLKGLRGDNVTMVKTNGGHPNSQTFGNESFEILSPESLDLLKAVHDDKVYEFLVEHPSWISSPG